MKRLTIVALALAITLASCARPYRSADAQTLPQCSNFISVPVGDTAVHLIAGPIAPGQGFYVCQESLFESGTLGADTLTVFRALNNSCTGLTAAHQVALNAVAPTWGYAVPQAALYFTNPSPSASVYACYQAAGAVVASPFLFNLQYLVL